MYQDSKLQLDITRNTRHRKIAEEMERETKQIKWATDYLANSKKEIVNLLEEEALMKCELDGIEKQLAKPSDPPSVHVHVHSNSECHLSPAPSTNASLPCTIALRSTLPVHSSKVRQRPERCFRSFDEK